MSKIITLSSQLANQIAAGEVVERPVSIVKELVENSIDAWADQITIEIQNGGIGQIIISDNGSGIASEDLLLALKKYSTSKIKSIEDLYHVMTFWFRGEALASISSVSNFQIISQTADEAMAHCVNITNGITSEVTSTAWEKGTKIIVSDLFYNTPARLNYLKKPKTEQSHISQCIQQFALSYPEIGFRFMVDGKIISHFKKWETLNNRIYGVFWSDFEENILPIQTENIGIQISGIISDPKISFPNKNRQCLFINKRIVSSPLIYRAIFNAYNRFIPHGNFPGYILHIDVDPTQIDVNVHPRKQEVRFANESELFRTVYHIINTQLDAVTLVWSNSGNTPINGWNLTDLSQQSICEPSPKYYTGSGTKFKAYSPYSDRTPNPAQWAIDFSRSILWNTSQWEVEQSNNDLHITPLGRIIGQIHNSYIVVETKNGLQVLDQHALAERIIYERLIRDEYTPKTQWLLLWVNCTLTPKESDILDQHASVFENMGFDFEVLSHGMVQISGIPDFVTQEDLEEVFMGIISDVWEEWFSKSTTLKEIRNKIFASTACRSAIKFWNKLNLFEMNALLHDAVIDYSATCPHGRPVVYDIDLEELKNKYER